MTASRYELNYCQNGYNLMIKRGSEGDENAVDMLVKDGGNLWDAVYGYALGGHDDLVQKTLDVKPSLASAAATGYARALNTTQTAKLKGKEQLKQHLVYGFALAGDETQIRAALNSRGGSKYLPLVIEGLASTNQSALLLELISNTSYFPKALKAAAKSGHEELVEELLQKLSINIKTLHSLKTPLPANVKTALGYVLEGYSEGRHFPEAGRIIELGINPMFCLNALAANGELDPNDACLLLSSVKTGFQDSLKTLMQTQFGLKSEQLSTTLVCKPAFEHPVVTESDVKSCS